MATVDHTRLGDNAPLNRNGVDVNEKPGGVGGIGGHRGGAFGTHGHMSPAEGYGPWTDDPVSYQRYFSRIANPGPTGMWAFAITVFLWSFYSVNTRRVEGDTAIIGMALFVGGLAQFMAGMWEFPRGNVYGSAFFTLYGAFWISYAANILALGGSALTNGASTGDGLGTTSDAVGLYLIVWFIVTIFFFLGVVRRSIAFACLTFFWALSYLMFAISNWSDRRQSSLQTAGGAFGFITAIIALYIGLSQLHGSEYSLWRMPLGQLGGRNAGAGSRAV